MIHIAYKNDYDYAIERHDKNNKAFEEALKKFKDIKDFREKSRRWFSFCSSEPSAKRFRGHCSVCILQDRIAAIELIKRSETME